MQSKVSRAVSVVSVVVAALAAIASLAGLVIPTIYRDQSEWMRATLLGNDFVTLLIAVPLLIAAFVRTRQGSRRAELAFLAALGYMIYNYSFYLFGASLNPVLPVYAVVLVLSAYALMTSLYRIDIAEVVADFTPSWRETAVAGFMIVAGAGLLLAWITQWAGILFIAMNPVIGETGVQLSAASDFTFLVPLLLFGGFLLWKRREWAYVVAPLVTIPATMIVASRALDSTIMAMHGMRGGLAFPIWGACSVVGLVAIVLLFGEIAPFKPQPKAPEADAGAAVAA